MMKGLSQCHLGVMLFVACLYRDLIQEFGFTFKALTDLKVHTVTG